ncbi:nicotinate (nicotinamide) nucleotide adenylyltransferase [Candidatus Kapaibacterium sp.]
MTKVGILGGSFNPVHTAHIKIALAMSRQLNTEKVLFIPCYASPFKDRSEYKVSDFHRIEMLKKALCNYHQFEIEDYEITKSETSFTIDTLKFLKKKYQSSQLILLMGADQSTTFEKWKSWQEILQQVTLCIARRDGNEVLLSSVVEKYIITHNLQVEYLDYQELMISSKLIRDKIAKNDSVFGLVPETVEEYIISNNLYR